MPSNVATYAFTVTGWLPHDCTRSPLQGHETAVVASDDTGSRRTQCQWKLYNHSGSYAYLKGSNIYSITIESTSSSATGSVHINHYTECSLLPVQLSSAASVDGIVCWSWECLSSGFWLSSPLQRAPAQLLSTLHNICSRTSISMCVLLAR